MANIKQKVRVTDIIKEEDVRSWKQGSNILISAGTGVGKSYFCKHTLYQLANETGGKILMLIHRSNCVEQFKCEIENDGKSDVITVITYQSLEYSRLKNTNKINLNDFQYIICDEFHYFFNDSSFNNKTAISFNMIINQTNSIKLFMSATGDNMANYMKRYMKKHELDDAIEYDIPKDFSFINKLTFFHKDATMEEFIKNGIENGGKGIFFIQSAEKAYKLYLKYKKHCLFNCSTNNNKYYDAVDKEKINKMLMEQKFDEQFLITTSCFDAGINIIDRELKHIIIDIVDIGSLIQCMGRKRIQDDDDKVNVYIKILNNQKLAGLKRSMEQKVEMAEFYMKNSYSMDKLIEKYPMQNDINNILYDDHTYNKAGDIISNTYTKKVNELMYFKKREDIADYELMMKKYGKFGYCKYLAITFGFYDEARGLCDYRLINEEYDLESYLESLIKENVIMLQVRDRSELIKKINAKQDGKQLKKLKTLNDVLEEREIDYRIKQFSTTRYSTTENGKKIKRVYKSAWKIVQVDPEVEGG